MTRVTYLLSVLLLGIGIACIMVGLPQVQVERGWTAVISGSVVASAGCVTFVMGALLRRLETLRTAILDLSPPALQPVAASQFGDELVAPDRSFTDWPDRPAVHARSGEPAAADFDLPSRNRTAGPEEPPARQPVPDPFAVAPREAEAANPFTPSPAVPPNVPSTEAQPIRKRPNLLGGLLSRRPAGGEDNASRAVTPKGTPGQTGRDAVPNEAVPPLHAPDGADYRLDPVDFDQEPFGDPPMQSEPLRPTYAESAPEEPHPAEPAAYETSYPVADHGADPSTADHPLRPSVVGRYTAGSASYIMYSNGMIEVETEDGVHQFSSMQDLKRFIENQEGARV